MNRLKHWIDCKLFKKHRYSYYTHECIVCEKPKVMNVYEKIL